MKNKECINLLFVPTRVANEFRNVRIKFDNLTIPLIKRKITAMVEATKWRRELIDKENEIYKHEFNGIVIIVERKNRCVQKVYTNPLSRKDDGRSARKYKNICRILGMNSDRNKFKHTKEEYFEKFRSKNVVIRGSNL